MEVIGGLIELMRDLFIGYWELGFVLILLLFSWKIVTEL